MKRSVSLVLSSVAVLALGVSLTYRASAPPASDMVSPGLPQSLPRAEGPGVRASSGVEVANSSVVPPSEKRAETPPKALDALRQEVLLLRREVSAVQRQLQAQTRAATVMAPESEAAPAQEPPTTPAARAEAERQHREQMALVEATFQREPADARWASEAVVAVQTALANDDVAQNLLMDLECRSHTCRLALAEDDTGEMAKFMPLFLQQLAQTLPSVTANHVDTGDGSKMMILYMSRDSHEPQHHGK